MLFKFHQTKSSFPKILLNFFIVTELTNNVVNLTCLHTEIELLNPNQPKDKAITSNSFGCYGKFHLSL